MESIKMFIKKYAIILTAIGLFSMALTSNFVFSQTTAQNSAQQLCANPADCPISSVNDIYRILEKIVGYVYGIFFIVAVLFILLAAFSFLTAQGDPQKIISARNQILWAAVAIAIALLSVGAQAIVRDFLSNRTI